MYVTMNTTFMYDHDHIGGGPGGGGRCFRRCPDLGRLRLRLNVRRCAGTQTERAVDPDLHI